MKRFYRMAAVTVAVLVSATGVSASPRRCAVRSTLRLIVCHARPGARDGTGVLADTYAG